MPFARHIDSISTCARHALSTIAAAVAASVVASGGANALSIELKDAAPDRVERQRAAAVGRLPLPGTPDVSKTEERLAEKGFSKGSPIMIRIFKAESELEIWMEKDGRFELFATYPICHWSGSLGPKTQEGDKQTPEGFYTITRRQLHHIGRWPRSLNLGFPNAYDKALGRTGSYILVHGGCSSVGCFAMTNPVISEIYELSAAALRNDQLHIPTHVFPFRMTKTNLARHKKSEWAPFWANLKEGYDSFERTRRAPRISVCENRYHIQDASPSEAGNQSPLAVCGAAAAAIQALDKSASLVPLQSVIPRLQLTADSQPPQASPEKAALHSGLPITMEQMYELIPNLNPPPRPVENAAARAAGRAPCNLRLPSCRKFMALKTGKRARRAEAARLKRTGNLALGKR